MSLTVDLLKQSYFQLLFRPDSAPATYSQTSLREYCLNKEIFSDVEQEYLIEYFNELDALAEQSCYELYADAAVKHDKEIGVSAAGGGFLLIQSDTQLTVLNETFKLPVCYQSKETNSHIAEYHALLVGIKATMNQVKHPECVHLKIKVDSQNLVKQLKRESRIRDKIRIKFAKEIDELKQNFAKVEIEYCPREENTRADKLAKEAIKALFV